MTAPVGLRSAQQNRYLSDAINELPGYRQALDLAEQAEQKLNSLAAPPEVPAELNPLVSGTISEEWITATLDHTATTTRIEQTRGLLLTLNRDARSTASSIYAANTDLMLTHFHDALTDLLSDVSSIAARLGGTSTPAEAIANDLGGEWRQLTALTKAYKELRDAQRTVMTNGLLDYVIGAQPIAGGEEHASDLFIANLDDLWPSWRKPGQIGQQVTNIDMSRHRYEPWPVDPTERLLWLATSSARPWVPTSGQLDALNRARRDRMNPNPRRIGARPPVLNQSLPVLNRVVRATKTVTPTEEADHV
jgi:hypothetical protein